ncbi:translation initiation factor IF-2-like [Panicum virgatum]|uniref:translation initiation factor IF-2-like n=1 Tax=Panicum virgatum TaxID=38727 RepID=UPI0019D5BE24|nr:translation initiation factor IF-2-like [Panicum virgatum]
MRPEKGYITLGLSHKGYVSKHPTPEARKANRLHGEAVKKKKKDAAKKAAARKRERKEEHEKACKIAWMEGAPRPPTPESTEEEDSSSGELNFSEPDDYEVVTGASPPLAHRAAGGEGSSTVLDEERLTPGSLVEPPAARTERRSPTPAAGQRATTKDVAHLAPTKALKTGAHATPHSAPRPPIRADPVREAEAVKFREAVARGALEAQLARAQEGGGVAGQSGTAPVARAEAEGGAGRGGAESTARPDVEAGGGGAGNAAQTDVEAGKGGADGAAQPEPGGGTGGEVQEHSAG